MPLELPFSVLTVSNIFKDINETVHLLGGILYWVAMLAYYLIMSKLHIYFLCNYKAVAIIDQSSHVYSAI